MSWSALLPSGNSLVNAQPTTANQNLAPHVSSQQTAWTGFLGGQRDGISRETGIRTDWTGGKLKVRWKLDVGDGYGMGVSADGRYYHFDAVNGLARLRGFDVRDGTKVWEFSYASNYEDLYGYDLGPRASPQIDGDRIYIYGVEGLLHCLNLSDGKKIWSCDTAKRFGVVQNFFGVGSSPVIFDNLLIVMVGGSPAESQSVPPGALDRVKSNGSGVVAFDKESGEVVYRTIDDLASYSSIRIVGAGDRALGYAWCRNNLYVFDPANGATQSAFPYRSRKLESVNAMTPIVDDAGNIFLSDCYEKGSVLLRPGTHQPRVIWSDGGKRDKSLSTHWNTPVLLDGYLYGCSGRHSSEAELRCVEWKTGTVQWREKNGERTTVTAIDGHLIVLGERGTLKLIRANPTRYQEVTQWQPTEKSGALKYPCWAAECVNDIETTFLHVSVSVVRTRGPAPGPPGFVLA